MWLPSLPTALRFAPWVIIALMSLIILIGYFSRENLKRDKVDLAKALLEASTALETASKEIKARDEISKANQSRLNDLDSRLSLERLRRQSAKCVPIRRTSGLNDNVPRKRLLG